MRAITQLIANAEVSSAANPHLPDWLQIHTDNCHSG